MHVNNINNVIPVATQQQIAEKAGNIPLILIVISEKEAQALMHLLDSLGYKWRGEDSAIAKTLYDSTPASTRKGYYLHAGDKNINHSRAAYYEGHSTYKQMHRIYV